MELVLLININDLDLVPFLLLNSQGKQRLLYSLLDAMQTLTSQSVVIGVSCRLVWTITTYRNYFSILLNDFIC